MVYIIAHSVEEEEIISFVCVCKKYIYMMERERPAGSSREWKKEIQKLVTERSSSRPRSTQHLLIAVLLSNHGGV